MRIEEAADHRASRGLLAYIRENFPNIPAFCDQKGIDRLKVQKAIRGKFARMDAEFAFAVERATDGAVPASWWVDAPPSDSKGAA